MFFTVSVGTMLELSSPRYDPASSPSRSTSTLPLDHLVGRTVFFHAQDPNRVFAVVIEFQFAHFPSSPSVKALDNCTPTRHHDAQRMSGITSRKCSMAELNALPPAEFVGRVGGIFEHSPWIAEKAAGQRPFATRSDLHAAMVAIVQSAGAEKQLALINAHPTWPGVSPDRAS